MLLSPIKTGKLEISAALNGQSKTDKKSQIIKNNATHNKNGDQ
jgi:hypothetical protein